MFGFISFLKSSHGISFLNCTSFMKFLKRINGSQIWFNTLCSKSISEYNSFILFYNKTVFFTFYLSASKLLLPKCPKNLEKHIPSHIFFAFFYYYHYDLKNSSFIYIYLPLEYKAIMKYHLLIKSC